MKVENSIGWQRIIKIMLLEFGKFENLKVLEFGAGSGTFSVLMAKLGSHTTLLDYSENALEKAHMLFKRNLFTAEFIKKDALSLEQGLLGKYDVSMSFGLAEHFKGVERVKIIKNHFDVLRKGGMAFISIPNKYNIPYRIALYIAEHSIPWDTGEEYPYSRKEIINICQHIGIKKYAFLGGSILPSLNFLYPIRVMKKRLGNHSGIRKEWGTFLDQYLSYGLVLYGRK